MRTARFGLTVGHDLTLGRLQPRLPLPVDPVAEQDLGPFSIFAMEVPGVKRGTAGVLELTAGTWIATFPRAFGSERSLAMGEAETAELSQAWNGTTLRTKAGALLLPPRYRHLTQTLAQKTKARTSKGPSSGVRVGVAPVAVHQS